MRQRFVFIDLETGGGDPKRHPIIQLAAVAVDAAGGVLDTFEVKLKFDFRKAKSLSLRKNHYHPGLWANLAREPVMAAKDFASFLRKHATTPVVSAEGESFHVAQLAAHNAAFDGPFLTAWYDKLGLYLPARRQILCTLQMSLWHCALANADSPTNYRLATLCQFFGIPFHAAEAHEALADALATVQLFQAIRSRSRQSNNQVGGVGSNE
ncbi:exonuclease domain-containing protein [Lacipirellula parvula]|uniref:Exonuclease domain-containing protein n=1 Tax=Lacipirellula parvula TaxID=2650471 RepID=A0A5K7XBU2_9BACT|nr:exonuclease domain-containing protein [Lacipirellula parvula]BBO34280.1 hypothetical protein PLANPX_3892 [Lacipirellula parvula]